MDNILQGLNPAQRTAVVSEASVLQVLAPPGSGKTKTLTARVAHLISERGLQPWNIIVCTFTVKAAKEMKERITSFVGSDLSRQLKLGTFHSVALRYLKTYGQHIGLPKDFGIADANDCKAILNRLIKQHGMGITVGQAVGRISQRKAKGDSIDGKTKKSVEQQEFDLLFAEYEASLLASNLLDYDDILLRCSTLLRSHPQCVSNVQAVLIDEFQDTNNIQYDLMSLFAQHQNVITIVGDPDQSIYGFRNAEIKNLARMRTQWPDTLTINLEENYRSSGAILSAAQNIIEQDESRPPKRLQATHSIGLRPVLRKLPSAKAEAQWLVSEIKRMQSLSGNMMMGSDFAVLLRSAALSREIESALGSAGIAYRMVGGTRFYDRAEIKLVVDYLRVIHSPDNTEAVERILNVPSRKIGEKTIKELREEAQLNGMSLWSLILRIAQDRHNSKTKLTTPNRSGLAKFVDVILSGHKKIESWNKEQPSVVDLINVISSKIQLQSYLRSKYAAEMSYEARWTNVEELMAQAAELTQPGMLQELAELDALPVVEHIEQRSESDQDVLSIFLANIALTASAEKAADEEGEKVQQVTISTIHAAKGLEWPVVFIPACYDGSIPHSRADDHDEERRLLYVGMTRAQALLYLSCPIKDTQRQETSLSTFLVHKGMSRYFEEHGPSMSVSALNGLCITLRRQCPIETKLTELKATLERDEDNYWPLNGEEPFEQLAKWDHSRSGSSYTGFVSSRTSVTTTMQQNFSTANATIPVQQGFQSVAARYDELMAQAQIKKLDQRAAEQEKKAQQKPEQQPKGRKRPIEGQGSIASFFKRPCPSPERDVESALPEKPVLNRPALQPLRNTQELQPTAGFMTAIQKMPSHKPRSTPMLSKPTISRSASREDGENAGGKYVFLSSSPPPPDPEDEPIIEEPPPAPRHAPAVPALNGFRPASTFHTTSMQQQSSGPVRKTLGVKRSMNGWPPPKRG
ncbi:ATP-dependent DNA helicase srs2 [Pseudocercospora fuligena]|uniref:DNA 3'-5' helicase n=1 Tax=Pseudocercospora fuligena TaxID=685502 RepID=A0A8H6RTL6_9PEZI|nr:ATP-dependent DNA helicase srs2 [Pseudocercospora fuligena]